MKHFSLFLLFYVITLPVKVTAQDFTSSNLPIILINTDGNIEIPDDPKIPASMKIIYNGEGMQNFITDQNTASALNYNGRIAIELRGSSSQDLPKKQYSFTTKAANDTDNLNVSLMNMPQENDWILNGLAYDSSLVRDYLSYNLARALGEYATRTQYCEVVLNGEYIGLYILQEKIKANSNRVDVTKIATTDNALPNLSGGYITKSDKTTGGDPVAWTMSSYASWQTVDFIHELPKPENVSSTQNTYIKGQFMSLKTTAANGNTSFSNGYPSLIDVPSFVDFMVMNEFASNVDGYQLSTFYHKDRNGKLRAGPIWDFNLTYGNDLFMYGYDRSHTDLWQFDNDDNDGAKFWKDLFDEPSFKCYFSKRWAEMTAAGKPLNLESIDAFIDNTVAYISAAALRENEKWGTVPDQATEIAFIKEWIAQRIEWINSQLPAYTACSNVAVPPLVITKINYNPATNSTFPVSNDQEFIEIKNTGTTAADLTGIYFRGTGFVYQFPPGQTLAPGASVTLASKASVFQSRYGFAASGEFTRNLSNSNQDLILADGFGNVIDHIHYYDSTPWPNADGSGYFLQLIDTGLDNNIASSWQAVDANLLATATFAGGHFNVYPNPTQGYFTIKSPETITGIVITDVAGRIISTIKAGTTEVKADLTAYPSGLYFAKITADSETATIKILKD